MVISNLEASQLSSAMDDGLLMSMAIRSDHALGCPGYYDQKGLGRPNNGVSHARMLECALMYDAKETSKRRIVFEALICGSLSLVASSLIEWMAWPSSLSVAAGGTLGFLGVTAIRELVTRFLSRKADAA